MLGLAENNAPGVRGRTGACKRLVNWRLGAGRFSAVFLHKTARAKRLYQSFVTKRVTASRQNMQDGRHGKRRHDSHQHEHGEQRRRKQPQVQSHIEQDQLHQAASVHQHGLAPIAAQEIELVLSSGLFCESMSRDSGTGGLGFLEISIIRVAPCQFCLGHVEIVPGETSNWTYQN